MVAVGTAASPPAQDASSSSSAKAQAKEAGGYWEVQSGAKRSRVQAKAEMSTGKTMLLHIVRMFSPGETSVWLTSGEDGGALGGAQDEHTSNRVDEHTRN